jgi:hypothetical protein
MPNWVFNSLAVSGYAPYVGSVKFQVGQPFTKMIDEYNLDTKEYDRKEVSFTNPLFAFWNITAPTDLEAYNKQPDYKLPIDEQLKFQGNDWYSWNFRNWGTKWDVAVLDNDEYPDTEILIDESGLVIYKFNTAWSPPFPVIQELSRQYPELVVDLEYEEETGWGGEITFKNGEVIDQKEYENKCNECDSFDKMEYDEEKEVSICKECGYEW